MESRFNEPFKGKLSQSKAENIVVEMNKIDKKGNKYLI